MKKVFLPLALAATTALGGCTALGGGGLLGDLLGGVGGGSGYGYNGGNDFQRAAVNACGREAERYGRVYVERADIRDRDYVYVYGRIDSRDSRNDQFTCIFRNDGRVVDFRTS